MATTSRNLTLAKSALIYSGTASHVNPAVGVEYPMCDEGATGPVPKMLWGFSGWPSSLKHNKLYSAALVFPQKFESDRYFSNFIYSLASAFNASTVTAYDAPANAGSAIYSGFFGPDVWIDQSVQLEAIRYAINYGIGIGGSQSISSSGSQWWTKIRLSGGGQPYLAVSYDDSVKVASKVQLVSGPTGSDISTLAAQYFSWKYVKNSSDSCVNETWAQTSAKIWWKAPDESSWHAINISGSALNYTVPAETFPSGKTIEYYIQGTDEDGTTSYTGTSSFSTSGANLSLTNYPSGSGIYTGTAISFTWDILEGNNSLTQASAVLYWKKQSDSGYTSISVTGNVKRITVPANTFPTGNTVQWYVAATDKAGVVFTSAVKSFTTSAPTVRAVTYPSGNGINFGSVLPFTWDLTNSSGSYSQASATLYWRASTSDPWTSISASGGTKGVNVPAYTFPSNKTIYWYVSATDTGGTTSQTSQLSFKTASPVITPQGSPTSGYADPRQAITFRWYFTDGTNSYDQQSAKLRWRVAGASAWNEISASGTTQSVTVAANTFPTMSVIEWMLTGTDRGGTSSQTSVYSFSTTASTAYAVCQSPVGKAEDGSKNIVFVWSVRNADGSTPSRTIVKWKKSTEASTQWRTVLDTTADVYTLTIPAGTFTAGGIDWQVVAYNRDGVAGPASLASFVCMVAPSAPSGLMATSVPRTTVSWQSAGQEAYEIQIDGKTVQAAFGPDITSWRKEEPLEDGVHTVRVRIQGAYGLWSSWAEATVSIGNVPDGAVTLAGKFRVDGALRWTCTGAGSPETVAVYRDGKWIGTATGKTAFTDRFVLGEHVYRVEYWYANGYYTRSNDLTGNMRSDVLRIAPLSGGDWMALRYSENSDRRLKYSWNQQNAMHVVTGSRFPVLETAPYENLGTTYDCAFTEAACVKKFEQFRGQIVILKSKGGNVLIGGMTATEKTVGSFFTAFSFAIKQCYWEDFIHDDAND